MRKKIRQGIAILGGGGEGGAYQSLKNIEMCGITSFSLPEDCIGQNLCWELTQQWSKGSKELTPHSSFPTAEDR